MLNDVNPEEWNPSEKVEYERMMQLFKKNQQPIVVCHWWQKKLLAKL